MRIKKYIEKISEELEDAEDYIKDAIDCKAEHPDHASILAKISEDELGHAQYLVKMFEDDFKQYTSDDPIYDDVRDSVLEMYTENSARVKLMHQTYSSK